MTYDLNVPEGYTRGYDLSPEWHEIAEVEVVYGDEQLRAFHRAGGVSLRAELQPHVLISPGDRRDPYIAIRFDEDSPYKAALNRIEVDEIAHRIPPGSMLTAQSALVLGTFYQQGWGKYTSPNK